MNPFLAKAKTRLAQGAASVKSRTGPATKQIVSDISEEVSSKKLGIAMGATSLGLGVTNYKNNKARNDADKRKLALEAKSLAALNKIHKSLEKGQTGA